jgi:hypothetical protein
MKAALPALRAAGALLLAATLAQAQSNPAARHVELSPPDCAGAENIIAEAAGAPANLTFMRVQHIGDPDSEALRGEVSRRVTWNVANVTGLSVPADAQRGYRDESGASAFQLGCSDAGFFINSFTFSHDSPLSGEGPSATIGRDLDPPPAAFRDAQSTLILEARVAVPYVYSPGLTPGLGVAQVSFLYYLRDVTSGTVFAHVIALFDNRPPGVGGAGVEFLGNDGVTAFASSPLLPVDASGARVQFVDVSPYSATMRFEQTWGEKLLFRAELPHAKFKAMLERIKREAIPAMSAEPKDYRVIFFGAGGEIMAGTGPDHNVMLGASVSGLALSMVAGRTRFRH